MVVIYETNVIVLLQITCFNIAEPYCTLEAFWGQRKCLYRLRQGNTREKRERINTFVCAQWVRWCKEANTHCLLLVLTLMAYQMIKCKLFPKCTSLNLLYK